jgi:hypothetical protein
MTVDKFHNKLKELIGEVEMSEMNTPTSEIIGTMKAEIYRLETSRTRFMHEMQHTY